MQMQYIAMGLEYLDLEVLSVLKDFSGLTVSNLHELTAFDKRALITILKRLEAKGLIRSEPVGSAPKKYYPLEEVA